MNHTTMLNRILKAFVCTLALGALLAPAAIAADVTDIGYLDQATLANMPVFLNANRQLAQFNAQLNAQFTAQMKAAKTDADRQRIQMDFQQRFSDKQRELIGPLFSRAQLAIANVSAAHNLSVVVDKRIIIYGGTDITAEVKKLFLSSQAINPPTATPPPAEIGFVDQNALDSLPRVKSANDAMRAFAAQQKKTFSPQILAAKGDRVKQQTIYQQYEKTVQDKQTQLLKPLVDATKSATAGVARSKNLILVVDRADVIYGGMDITSDVQSALSK